MNNLNMPYDALVVANSFLDLANLNKQKLDLIKLQKLIYFAHGWSLAIYDKPLINEEIQAWQFGPVILSVYHEFKRYGLNSIKTKALTLTTEGRSIFPQISLTDNQAIELVKKIWDVYGKFTGIQLSNISHELGTPWAEAQKRNIQNLVSFSITNEEIKKYFISLIKKDIFDIEKNR